VYRKSQKNKKRRRNINILIEGIIRYFRKEPDERRVNIDD